MVHIIEGRSGSGKTEYLYDLLSRLAEGGERRLVYLIPEQSSFECETAFLRRLGPKLAKNVSVMSFTRLYDMVMSATGGVSGTPIDDSVRKILMSLTLEDCADSLELYERQAAKPRFAQTALSAIKEFKQCGILPDDVREKARTAGGGELEKKLSELALIYELFNAHVAKSGVDPFDNDIRLEMRIAETGFFKGYTVAVDDFSGFTAQQHKILSLIMEQAEEFYISLCMEPSFDDELFFTVNRTKKRVAECARGLGLKLASPVRLTENRRTENAALRRLEESIYRRANGEEAAVVQPDGVVVMQADDVYDECDYIAGRISDLALGGECRWRDIAVVFRDGDKYSGILDRAFDKCGIPYFMSKPQPVEAKPIMRLAVSALEYALTPNDEDRLLDAAKSGLLGIPDHSIAQLENYVFVWSLKGRQFYSDFTMDPEGYADRFTDESKRRLGEINDARRRIAEPFGKLLDRVNGRDLFTARDISEALYFFMEDCGVPELLKSRAERRLEFSDEEIRLWDMLMDILNKMHAALGQRRISLKRYCELFKMVLEGEDISDIPQTLDQVLVGKADSVRFSKPYAVFVIGALSGEFPHLPVADGVFSDAERQRLISLGLPLYDCVEDLFRQERFFVYNAVSAPTDKLFVTYPKSELRGGSAEPSSIVTEIERVFPSLSREYTSSQSDLDRITGERSAFELYARSYGSKTPFQAALGEYLEDSFDYGERLASLGAPIKNTKTALSDKGVSAALFGRDKHLSASQIEEFYQCRFKYFFNYGLRLKERRKAQLDGLVYGSLLHYILEHMIREYIKRDCTSFSDGELRSLLDRLMKSYIDEFLGGEGGKSQRFLHLYNRSKERVARVLRHMLEELEQSQFKPVDAELEIGSSGGGLPEYAVMKDDGTTVYIRGKIDRVDMMDDDGRSLVRIIDYKTNGREFSLEEVVNGLNLQMLIYLAAVAKNGSARYGSQPEPAAVLYMRADIGSVSVAPSGKKTNEQEAQSVVDKELRMTGVALDSETVGQGMGKSRNKYVSAQKVTQAQLSMIFDCVDDMILRMSRELDGGRVPAVPVENKIKNSTACDYCDYKPVCRREDSDRLRVVENVKPEETLGRLESEFEKKKEENVDE